MEFFKKLLPVEFTALKMILGCFNTAEFNSWGCFTTQNMIPLQVFHCWGRGSSGCYTSKECVKQHISSIPLNKWTQGMKVERNQRSDTVFYSFLLRIVQYPAGVKTDHTAMRRPPSWFHHAQPIGKREQFPHSQSGTQKCHSNLTRALNLSTSQNRRISFYLSIAGGILVWTRHLQKEINGKFFFFR